MDLARRVVVTVTRMRLEHARDDERLAMLRFLRADYFDRDCTAPVRSVRAAHARATRLETSLSRLQHH